MAIPYDIFQGEILVQGEILELYCTVLSLTFDHGLH